LAFAAPSFISSSSRLASHRPLLTDAALALRQHVEFRVLGQQLDVDARPHLLPGQSNERFFQLAEPPLRRADQIGDGRIGLPHLGEHIFCRNAAIHHPNALRLAVLAFDLVEKRAQRRLVRSIAWQHFVGERKALGRDHERDDHLDTIRVLVAAVAMAALVGVVARRVRLEIRASQVVEQHIELRAEQILPALLQMRKQRGLVGEDFVEAPIECILLDQRELFVEQVAHGALFEP
jgi:hypothetical protein